MDRWAQDLFAGQCREGMARRCNGMFWAEAWHLACHGRKTIAVGLSAARGKDPLASLVCLVPFCLHAGANQSPLGAELQLVMCTGAVAVELLTYLVCELGSRELVKLCGSMGRAVRVRGWPSCWSYGPDLGVVAACPGTWRGQGWCCSGLRMVTGQGTSRLVIGMADWCSDAKGD